MDKRPVGVFDTGCGGLSAFRELLELMPGEELIYIGDSGAMPYGGKTDAEIISLARGIVEFFVERDAKALLCACGTITVAAMDTLRAEYPELPIFGVVEPASRAAAESDGGVIGVIATEATVRSEAFRRAIEGIAPEKKVVSVACPKLAPLVESGAFRKDPKASGEILRGYLKPVIDSGATALILGCTHYEHIFDEIARITGPGTELFGAGRIAAQVFYKELARRGMVNGAGGGAAVYTTGSPGEFAAAAESILDGKFAGIIGKIMLKRV